jgi:hypothetical protein
MKTEYVPVHKKTLPSPFNTGPAYREETKEKDTVTA